MRANAVSVALGCALAAACTQAGNFVQAGNTAQVGNTARVANNSAAADNGAVPAPRAVEHQVIELIPTGFSTGSPGLHHSNMITFGQPQAQVVAQLSAILGQPASGRNVDCPSGEVDTATFGSLTLNFEGGRFAGWVLRGPRPALASYHGLAIGIQRGALVDELAAEPYADSTLGTEVRVNGIGAILSGPGADARVTALFAGVTCFAR